jgi:hypothetical protein
MKTKFVTSYYMDVSQFTNNKWIGSSVYRKPRYLSSLISHCKNFSSYDIVCYTHQINYDELLKIKNDYNLDNFIIKVKELDDIKYTEKINKVVNNVPDYMEKFALPGRPPQVMWGKFDLIRLECTNDVDNIYWIDAGLQAIQLFPRRYNPYINDSDVWTNIEKTGNFNLLFNESLINKLTNKSYGKFVTLLSTQVQDIYYSLEENYVKPNNYPIAGFFGGERSMVIEYCDYFDSAVDVFIKHNILCFEQTIMKYVTDIFPPEKLHILSFDTHALGLNEKEFHDDEWNPNKNLPKPIWRIWEEIRDDNI